MSHEVLYAIQEGGSGANAVCKSADDNQKLRPYVKSADEKHISGP